MMSSDRSSGSNRFTRLLQHAQRELERAEARKPGTAAPAPAAPPPERPAERGVVGGSLDRLVRGTIACDALATLASHLLQLEPALVRTLAWLWTFPSTFPSIWYPFCIQVAGSRWRSHLPIGTGEVERV